MQRIRSVADPAYSSRSPFHSEQCEKAIALAERALAADAGNRRARLILAEGWLCRGLKGDPSCAKKFAGSSVTICSPSPLGREQIQGGPSP